MGTPEELAGAHGQLKEQAAAAGRDMSSIEITSTWIYSKEGADSLARYEDMGAERMLIPWSTLPDKEHLLVSEVAEFLRCSESHVSGIQLAS